MRLWQCTLLLGVLAHHSTGSKSGKAIVTKDVIIIPRYHNSKVCLYTDDHLTVFDPTAHQCQCHEAVQKVLNEYYPKNRNNYGDQITSGTPNRQYPQSSSPDNQQRPSGPYDSRNTPLRGVPSNPNQFQPSDPTTRGLLPSPQSSDENQRRNAGPTNVPFSGRPQGSINISKQFDPNSQQILSGLPSTQRQAPSSGPSGMTQQPQGQSFDPSNQQSQQPRGQPQALTHQNTQTPNQNNHYHGIAGPPQGSSLLGNLGPNNGPDSKRTHYQSFDPNAQPRFSEKGPWNNLNSPAQQPRSQSYDPRNPQKSISSEHPPQSYPSQTSDPSHQRRISGPAQTGVPYSSGGLGGPFLQPQSSNPTTRALPLNQQHPQSQNQNNQYGRNSGPTSGPNSLSPHIYGSNNPQKSSNFPNTQTCQSRPDNIPTGISQQPGSSDPSLQHYASRPLPQALIPQTANNNQHGGNTRPEHKPDNERPQGSNQYPRTYVPDNQQQLSDPKNSFSTPRRSNSTRMTQQLQSSDPSNRQENDFRGSAQPQNVRTYPNDQNKENPRFTGIPSSRKPQDSDQRPLSYDSRNQQGRPSNGTPQPMNQRNRQYSDQSSQNRGNSDANEPHIERLQGFKKPQSQIPGNQQESPPSGAQNDGSTQLCCADGKKPQLGYFSGHFEVCGGKLRWILDSVQTSKSKSLQEPAEISNQRLTSPRNIVGGYLPEEVHEKSPARYLTHRRPGSHYEYGFVRRLSYQDHTRNIMYDPRSYQPCFGGWMRMMNPNRSPNWFTVI